MSWKDDYKQAVLRYFLDHGRPMPVPGEEYAPWSDGVAGGALKLHEHMTGCALNVAACTMVEETNWTVWGGTFGEDTTTYGCKVTLTCECGHITGRPWRLDTESLADLINGICA